MAAIVWTDVTALFPGLSTVPLAAQTEILAWANEEAVNPAEFGGEESRRYRLARIYLAAHRGETSRPSVASDYVASKTVSADSLSVSYSGAATIEELQATEGGAAYLELVNASPARVGFVVGTIGCR